MGEGGWERIKGLMVAGGGGGGGEVSFTNSWKR